MSAPLPPLTPEEKADYQKMIDAATDGPWTSHTSDNIITAPLPGTVDGRAMVVAQALSSRFAHTPPIITTEVRDRNAAFIAASRDFGPRLLQENETLRQQLTATEQALRISKQNCLHVIDIWTEDGNRDLAIAEGLRAERTEALRQLAASVAQTQQMRERVVLIMKAVCASCNHGEAMNSFNRHVSGMECEAANLREVLWAIDGNRDVNAHLLTKETGA